MDHKEILMRGMEQFPEEFLEMAREVAQEKATTGWNKGFRAGLYTMGILAAILILFIR